MVEDVCQHVKMSHSGGGRFIKALFARFNNARADAKRWSCCGIRARRPPPPRGEYEKEEAVVCIGV